MITGFNTDIVYQGVTYHVQTEDKGLETPLILSLVYDRGTILASKRSPYNDLLAGDFNEKELEERLHRQHKLICAAVKAGRLEDLKQMTRKESAAKRAQKEVKSSIPAESIPPAVNEKPAASPPKLPPLVEPANIEQKSARVEKKVERKIDELPPAPQILHAPAPLPKPQFEVAPVAASSGGGGAKSFETTPAVENEIWEIPLSILEDLIIEEVQVVEEELILPAEAVAVLAESAPQAAVKVESAPVTVSAQSIPADESLKIELLNEVSFKSGERKTLMVLVKGGSVAAKNPNHNLGGAHVMVKILGSTFRPQVFHAKTDSSGVATVNLQLPKFSRGRAAILIRAMSGGEETELRRVISHD